MSHVHICEVGPRDWLQNAKHLMPTAAKKAWIRALAEAGLNEIEVGSFVPPKLIPAMADTGEIVAFARTIPGLKVVALAPNLKGFQRALEAGAHKVTFPVSARDRESTRLNSSHSSISYAVFCSKNKSTTFTKGRDLIFTTIIYVTSVKV